MARMVSIGSQDFEMLRREGYFYIDKTNFIREWWESGDSVTLLTRPRRFGKTLNMNMLEKFFSVEYADRGELFMAGGKIPQDAGNLSGSFLQLCRYQGDFFFTGTEKNMPDCEGTL